MEKLQSLSEASVSALLPLNHLGQGQAPFMSIEIMLDVSCVKR